MIRYENNFNDGSIQLKMNKITQKITFITNQVIKVVQNYGPKIYGYPFVFETIKKT